MSEPAMPAITSEVSDRICKHMNDDHADAVLLYVKAFGGSQTATAATMKAIDAEGMDLEAQVADQTVPVRIAFDHSLKDAKDAHHTLVEMLKQVRTK